MKENGKLVISLDFELLWGMRDKKTIETYGENILGVRQSIPKMIEIFNEYEINATFSTVGFLFAKNKNEILEFSPNIKPKYIDENLSPYNGYFNEIGDNENVDKFHFASSIIDELKKHSNHEISTHTFSHYYCLEKGQNITDFKRDLVSAINIAKKNDIILESIIFPRNQYNKDYLSICTELGINSFRGNEKVWFNKADNGENESMIKRIFRLSDSYINISGHHTYSINKIKKTTPYNIPSSRFLRAFNPKLKFIEKLKLNRIKKSMTYAAKNGHIYHLWWHPHNFGTFQKENFEFLREILIHYSILKSKYNFESLTMNNLAKKTSQNNG
jgi:hypothetical protein